MAIAPSKVTRQDKRLMIAAAGLCFLALILYLSLPTLVDVNVIKADMQATVRQATGLDIEVQDGIQVSMLPYPHVVMKNLYIANIPGASTSFLLSVRSLTMKLRPTSLFSSHPIVESADVDGVTIELERLKNGGFNWQEMAKYLAESASHTASNGGTDRGNAVDLSDIEGNLSIVVAALSKISNFAVTNAELHFTDSQYGIISNYSDISLKFVNGSSKSNLSASVSYGDLPLRLSMEMDEVGHAFSHKSSKAKIRFESDQTSLDYEGMLSFGDSLQLNGKSLLNRRTLRAG